MKSFKSLTTAERVKFNVFHQIHFDINILELTCKDLMSNLDPDFICCLASKLDTFIQSEVLPLSERHFNDIHNHKKLEHETDNNNINMDDNLGSN